MRQLCDAYAAGINHYMVTHPDNKPKLITRVQPWFILLNSGASLETLGVGEADVRAMYPIKITKDLVYEMVRPTEEKQAGSNGWAIAGKHTTNKAPILLINPHSEFYNRIEVQISSDEGLNVYGAPFLGDMHIWQGFNDFCGWMHTVTLSDAKDIYAETVESKENQWMYEYDNKWLPLDSSTVTLLYKDSSQLKSVQFTVYKTKHGPVIAKKDNQWLSVSTKRDNAELLSVQWNITKSKSTKEFISYLDKRVMTGTNTIYADKSGNIGYWHGNFVPIRDKSFDWKRIVPGNTSKTDWKGTHPLNELPHFFNPSNGWVQNCNSSPIYGAGKYDSVIAKKPEYMHPDGHTPRAMNAVRLLSNIKNANIDTIINMANNSYLMSGPRFIPALLKAYDDCKVDSIKNALQQPIATLAKWDFRADTNSVATTLSVYWVERLMFLSLEKLPRPFTGEEQYGVTNGSNISLAGVSGEKLLSLLTATINDLKKDWGTWEVQWGKINRYQRNGFKQEPSDTKPSWAVTATPGFMGSTNAYVSKKAMGTKIHYGVSGNTFVTAVSFGKKIEAKSILTGGSSSDPSSSHFTDQANGYINHDYKPVYFYKADVLKNKEMQYHPGEEVKPRATLNHTAIYVVDLKKSGDFYQNIIGLDTIPEPFHDNAHIWMKTSPYSTLHIILGADKNKEYYKNQHTCFSVANFENFIFKLKQAGISFEDVSGNKNSITTRIDGVHQIWLQDPDGYWLEINDIKY
jgi:acyl-homoserine lactone acylase PvdQ/catechol 2,3-dioxygenase-like lactoylglutathione lyase family enzyme